MSGNRWIRANEGWWWAGNDPTDSWGSRVYPDFWVPLPDAPEGGAGNDNVG